VQRFVLVALFVASSLGAIAQTEPLVKDPDSEFVIGRSQVRFASGHALASAVTCAEH